MRFGIPYAYGEINDGRLYRACPVCGEKLPEETDAHGEETTTNYAEHYEAEHAGRVADEDPRAVVGVTETRERIREFRQPNALKEAERYVGTLPNAEAGVYFVDWPCYRNAGICGRCGASITQSFADQAWEDESGACGCGDGEHEPEER